MKLNLGSGLDASVARCLGQTCVVDLEDGWGWEGRKAGKSVDVEWDLFFNRSARFELVELLQFRGIIRGVRGRVIGECQDLGKEILGFSLFDGFDFDLDQTLCPGWRLSFDVSGFSISREGEVKFDGDSCLFGFGRKLRLSKSDN